MAEKSEWNGDEPETEYDPSTVEVDRGRQQGLGMGARDLARQRDPSAPAAAPNEGDEGEDATDEGQDPSKR